jgi:hypothetical protein
MVLTRWAKTTHGLDVAGRGAAVLGMAVFHGLGGKNRNFKEGRNCQVDWTERINLTERE